MRDGLIYGAGAVGVGIYVLGQQSAMDTPEAAAINYTADEAAELFDAAMAGDVQTSAMIGMVEKYTGSEVGVPEAAMFIAACGLAAKVISQMKPHFDATGAWLDRVLNGQPRRPAVAQGDDAED